MYACSVTKQKSSDGHGDSSGAVLGVVVGVLVKELGPDGKVQGGAGRGDVHATATGKGGGADGGDGGGRRAGLMGENGERIELRNASPNEYQVFSTVKREDL